MDRHRRSLYFTDDETVEVREAPIPEPAGEEVLVETIVSAISPGTELLVYRGNAPADMATDATIDALSGSFTYPLQYGYAAVGTVTELGGDVHDEWLGRRVFCFNPHESHFTATVDQLVPVPETIGTEAAALVPLAETAVTLVHDGRPRFGETLAVFGQGLIGLLTTAALGSFPIDRLVTVEPIENRRERSIEMGADSSVPPATISSVLSSPNGPEGPPAGADLTYELSGNPAALDEAVGVTGYDGRLIVGSWYGEKGVEVNLGSRFHRSRIEVRASQVSTIDPSLRGRWNRDRRFELAFDLIESIDTEPLITDRVPIEDAGGAYENYLGGPERTIGTLLTY